jgi:hypothetical protein
VAAGYKKNSITLGNLDEIRPRTTVLLGGRCFRGSNVPARSVSYSSCAKHNAIHSAHVCSLIVDMQTHVVNVGITGSDVSDITKR